MGTSILLKIWNKVVIPVVDSGHFSESIRYWIKYNLFHVLYPLSRKRWIYMDSLEITYVETWGAWIKRGMAWIKRGMA